MWFFAEFLPEIIYCVNKINKSIKNIIIFILFFINILYVGYGYLFGFNIYISLTLLSILMVSIFIFNKNTFLREKNSYVVVKNKLNKGEYKIFVKYKHLISNNIFNININDTNIRVFVYPLWGGTFIEINDVKVNNFDDSNIYEKLVRGVIFSRYIKDIQRNEFLFTINIRGFFKPYILVSISNH